MSGIAKVQALQAVASSEKAVHSTKMGFQAGMRTNVDILNAEEQLTNREAIWPKPNTSTCCRPCGYGLQGGC